MLGQQREGLQNSHILEGEPPPVAVFVIVLVVGKAGSQNQAEEEKLGEDGEDHEEH
tara:strand:- start:62 stop:229 length:168 start_codon:yes stop_codon:yes gene_type:complete